MVLFQNFLCLSLETTAFVNGWIDLINISFTSVALSLFAFYFDIIYRIYFERIPGYDDDRTLWNKFIREKLKTFLTKQIDLSMKLIRHSQYI